MQISILLRRVGLNQLMFLHPYHQVSHRELGATESHLLYVIWCVAVSSVRKPYIMLNSCVIRHLLYTKVLCLRYNVLNMIDQSLYTACKADQDTLSLPSA